MSLNLFQSRDRCQAHRMRSDWLLPGILLLGGATALWLLFEGLAYHEQAQAPGEKDFGIGVMAILFVIPASILGTGGAGCLIVSGLISIRCRLVRGKSK
jgi:hypothetical protein